MTTQENFIQEVTIHEPSVPDGITISRQQVRELFCDKASDAEIELFLMLCKSQNLNPFKREAYLIKYAQDKPATMVVGKEVFTKRAMNHPLFRGFENGIIVERNGAVLYEQGCFSLDTDKLLGGWIKVYLDGLVVPMFESVKLEEADAPSYFWKKMPNHMIAKVALVRGLRNAFPDIFGGLYDSDEIPETAGVLSGDDGKPMAEIEAETKTNAEAIAIVSAEKPKVKTLNDYEDIPVDEVDDGVFPCPDHTGELLRKRDGKFGEFWSHKSDDLELPKGYCNLSLATVRRTMRTISEGLGWDKNDQRNFEALHLDGGGINDLFNDPSGMIRFLKALTNEAKERDDMIREEESYQAELDEVRLGDLFDTNNN